MIQLNRDNIDWIRWIEQGKMIYGNKEKIQVSIAQQRTNLAEVNNQDVRTSSDTYYLDSTESILLKFGDVNDIFTNEFEFYKEQKDRNEVFKKFRNYYAQNDSLDFDVAKFQSDEFYDALENKNIEILKRYTSFDDNYEISNLAREILSEKLGITEIKTPEELETYLNQFGKNIKQNDMENYVITQERNGEITVLASSYKNAFFVGGDYLSDYETYNLEKVNNLLKDLQESNPDNEYRIHALRGVHHKKRTVAGGQRARDFVAEVHMAGRVDEVEHVLLAVLVRVGDAHGLGLDGDAAFALKVHAVEVLFTGFACRDDAGVFEDAVGQRGLAVVDMRNDGEVADMAEIGHSGRLVRVGYFWGPKPGMASFCSSLASSHVAAVTMAR